jgi:hypothetical protein
MSDQPRSDQPGPDQPAPDQPVARDPAEPSTERLETPPPDAPPPPPQARKAPGRFGRLARHRATQLVAAGLAGLVIGGGVVALVGDDEDRPARGFRTAPYFDHGWAPPGPHRPGWGPRWDEPGR